MKGKAWQVLRMGPWVSRHMDKGARCAQVVFILGFSGYSVREGKPS